jgi:alginate O-acetyltransferase complex protein AlgI
MLFNSLAFAIFFLIVYPSYLLVNHKWQNRLLLLASYIFYGYWNWKFLSLLLISTALDYICGLEIYKSGKPERKKLFLYFSIFGNLIILGFFKYYNFFTANLQALLNLLGLSIQPYWINIILPIGISFYTFQTMSYTIDIYREEIKPTNKFFDFSLFVAFFPQLVIGPIERAKHLLPQIISVRKVTLDKFNEGAYLIFWGLFQKIFVADNLAKIVNPVFGSNPPHDGARVILAIYAFALQVTFDFSGYSDIARGLAKIMGFDLMVNFNLPLLATNIQDFWRRYHISLSNWVRDYIYIPLGGSKKGTAKTYINIIITFTLLGLWHGAAWHFIFFGLYQSLLMVAYIMLKPKFGNLIKPRSPFGKNVWLIIRILFIFQLTSLGFLFFRAQSMAQILKMIESILFNFRATGANLSDLLKILFFSALAITIQVFQFWKNDPMIILKTNALTRTVFYLLCYCLLLTFGVAGHQKFIYFQF